MRGGADQGQGLLRIFAQLTDGLGEGCLALRRAVAIKLCQLAQQCALQAIQLRAQLAAQIDPWRLWCAACGMPA
ncbi:hypothetical protein D3C72_2499270 [compost metagenome]